MKMKESRGVWWALAYPHYVQCPLTNTIFYRSSADQSYRYKQSDVFVANLASVLCEGV